MIGFETATIAERIDLTGELAIFRLNLGRRLDFIPGQFATLALESDGARMQRAYSMVSAPHEELLEFFVELVPEGKLTPLMWDLKAGDTMLVRAQAAGNFILDTEGDATRHLMLATVTGVAPFISMLRAHTHRLRYGVGADLRFAVVYAASYAREFGPYHDELRELSREGWLAYVPTISRPAENPEWAGEVGRVEDIVRKVADTQGYNDAGSIAYACGHPIMIENVRAILQRARFPRQRIRTEKFFTIKLPKAG